MNDNKIIKVLHIITLTLSLMLLVFALAKKVGLCASDSVSALPLPVGAGYGNTFSQSELDTIVANIETAVVAKNDSDIPYCEVILFNGTYNGDYEFLGFSSTNISVSDSSDLFTSGATLIFNNVTSYGGCYRVWVDPTTLAVTGDMWRSVKPSVYTSSWFDNGVLKSGYLELYPLYVSSDISYNGVTYFSFRGEEIDPEVAEILQNIVGGTSDFAGQMQELTSNLPTDSGTTSTGQWFSNIFSVIGGGFTGLFRSFYSFLQPYLQGFLDFFSDIFDKITDFYNLVSGRFNSLIDKVDSILGSLNDNTTESDIYDAWVDAYESSYIYAFIDEFSVVDAGLKNIANTQAASSVSFTFLLPSFNVPTVSGSGSVNALANHNSITVGFNWYTSPRFSNGDSIRDRIWLPFCAFLVAGFCWRLYAKIPSILGGQSGLSDGVHKTIELSNIYANRVN